MSVAVAGDRRACARTGAVEIATYGEELVRLALRPESKMLGPDGSACKATTKGLLRPRPVNVAGLHLVGKEGNRIEDVATGEVIDPEEVLTDYGDDTWERLVIPVGRAMGVRRLARHAELSLSQVVELLHCRASPQARTRVRVLEAVAEWAACQRGLPPQAGVDDRSAALAGYLAHRVN